MHHTELQPAGCSKFEGIAGEVLDEGEKLRIAMPDTPA
jgi:hypothetical protein